MDTEADLPRPGWPRSPGSVESSSRYAPTLADLLALWWARRTVLALSFVAGAIAGYSVSFALTPVFTARTAFFVPQVRPLENPTRTSSSDPLARLGEQLPVDTEDVDFEMLLSTAVLDRVVEAFELTRVYGVPLRERARRELQDRVRVTVGKNDHLFSVEVEDTDPSRAAAMANRYADEFRRIKEQLAKDQAHRRRTLLETQVAQTRGRLDQAQHVLEAGGFDEGALRSEPMQMVSAQATLQGQVAAAEVRLRTLREAFGDDAPALRSQQAELASLRDELARLAEPVSEIGDSRYAEAYREFKYEQTLLELLAPLFELARVEEGRSFELRVVDRAQPPDRRSRPRRSLLAASSALLAFLVAATAILLNARDRPARGRPAPSP